MATTKRTMPKKTTKAPVTKTAVIESENVQVTGMNEPIEAVEEVKEVVEVKAPVKAKPEVIEYQPTDPIWTTSVTNGELYMIGKKTKNLYVWANIGDKTEVEYQDLLAERTARGMYIFKPLFVIEDDDLLEQKGWEAVKEAYQGMYSIDEIEAIFNLDFNSFCRTMRKLPAGIVNTVKSMAADKIQHGTLDSLQKINFLDTEYGTDLRLYI